MGYSVVDNLEVIGHDPEEGHELHGLVYYVTHTDDRGRRVISPPVASRFTDRLAGDPVETGRTILRLSTQLTDPVHIIVLAAFAERHGYDGMGELLGTLAVERGLRHADWHPWFPVYGSLAYETSGQEALDIEAERNEDAYVPA